MIKPSKIPPVNFVLLQNRRKSGSDGQAWHEAQKVFAAEFKLRVAGSYRLDCLRQSMADYLVDFIDHSTVFKHWSGILIVTQPYGHVDVTEAEIKLKRVGAELVDLSEWAYYFPPKAGCYGIFMSPAAQKIFKILSGNEIRSSAAAIFGAT